MPPANTSPTRSNRATTTRNMTRRSPTNLVNPWYNYTNTYNNNNNNNNNNKNNNYMKYYWPSAVAPRRANNAVMGRSSLNRPNSLRNTANTTRMNSPRTNARLTTPRTNNNIYNTRTRTNTLSPRPNNRSRSNNTNASSKNIWRPRNVTPVNTTRRAANTRTANTRANNTRGLASARNWLRGL